MARTLLACIACLILGFGLGILVPRGEKASVLAPSPDQPLAPLLEADDLNDFGVSRRQEAAIDDRWRRERDLPELEGVVIPLSLLREIVPSKSGEGIQGELFEKEDVIERSLEITDYEKTAIQADWRKIREQVLEIEVLGALSESLDDGSAIITIPNSDGAMQGLTGGFHSQLERILGEDRAKVFAALKNTAERFSSAAAERSYAIAFEEIPNDRWRYHIEHEVDGARKVWVSETMPDELRHLTDILDIPVNANEGEVEEPEE